MKPSSFLFVFLGLLLDITAANVEKVIFLGPTQIPIPQQTPTLIDLHLDVLTPDKASSSYSLRTELGRVFPDAEHQPHGHSSWFILYDLTEQQRYELRVCWAATEPTNFKMDVYPVNTVFDTPELIQSLAAYSSAQQASHQVANTFPTGAALLQGENHGLEEVSVLLLRVQAAADYFTDNTELMTNPPPVLVDLILDPFLLGVLPRSLVPAAGYITLVAIASCFVAGFARSQMAALCQPDVSIAKKET